MSSENPFHMVPFNHKDEPSCEYSLVRLGITHAKMSAVVQCIYHGTTFSVEGPVAGRQNEKGQLLIDEFDYRVGRDLAAGGFDNLQRKPDRESFNHNYAEYLRTEMAAIMTRLKADDYPPLADVNEGSPDERKVAALKRLQAEINDPEMMRMAIQTEIDQLHAISTTITAVIRMEKQFLHVTIEGEQYPPLPSAAVSQDSGMVEGLIGGAILGELAKKAMTDSGINIDAMLTRLQAAAIIKKMELGSGAELPDEKEWN